MVSLVSIVADLRQHFDENHNAAERAQLACCICIMGRVAGSEVVQWDGLLTGCACWTVFVHSKSRRGAGWGLPLDLLRAMVLKIAASQDKDLFKASSQEVDSHAARSTFG